MLLRHWNLYDSFQHSQVIAYKYCQEHCLWYAGTVYLLAKLPVNCRLERVSDAEEEHCQLRIIQFAAARECFMFHLLFFVLSVLRNPARHVVREGSDHHVQDTNAGARLVFLSFSFFFFFLFR